MTELKALLATLSDKEAWLARGESFKAACRELTLKEWCLVSATAALLLFTGAQARTSRRIAKAIQKQTALLQTWHRQEESRRESDRALAWVRLRGSLWTVMDLLRAEQNAATVAEGAAFPRERALVLLIQMRRILEGEELNPVLAADAEALASWRDALSTARLIEGSLTGPVDPQAAFISMQTSRISQDALNVWARLAQTSGEAGPPPAPVFTPPETRAPGPAAEDSPAPISSPAPTRSGDAVPAPKTRE